MRSPLADATKAERMLAAIQHREPDVVPGQEDFMDDDAAAKFRARFCPPPSGDWGRDAIAYAEMLDNHTISVGGGGLRSRIVERGADYELVEYENGMKWRIHHNPWWREYADYPIKSERDVGRLAFPNADDPARYVGIRERAEFARRQGYFTQAGSPGVFSGLWYYWVSFETVMDWLVEKPDLLRELVARVGDFGVRVASRLAEQGVDSIGWGDDLGYNEGTFFSPRHYREQFFPWHQRMAAAVHERGAVANMHSHGNVNALLPDFLEAGIDVLNPIGPSDRMVLSEVKARFGDRLTLMGGISKHIGSMSREELEAHVEEVVRVGSPGGGFVLFSEGSVPITFTPEDFEFYIHVRRKYRARYGAAGRLTEI